MMNSQIFQDRAISVAFGFAAGCATMGGFLMGAFVATNLGSSFEGEARVLVDTLGVFSSGVLAVATISNPMADWADKHLPINGEHTPYLCGFTAGAATVASGVYGLSKLVM